MHKLSVTLREISGDDAASMDDAWRNVHEAVHAAGGRAWRFIESQRRDHYLEFIEWEDPSSPLADLNVGAALDTLERFGTGSLSLWEEMPDGS